MSYFLKQTLVLMGVLYILTPVEAVSKEVRKEPPSYPWPVTGVTFKQPGLLEISIGQDTAPVVIYEISAVTCHHCSDFHKTIYPLLKEKYIDTGKVRLVFRHCPIDGVSMRAAMVLSQIPAKDRLTVVERLWETQPTWFPADFSLKSMQKFSEDLEKICHIPSEKVMKYIKDDHLAEEVIKDRYALDDAIQIDGTPTFIINGDVFLKEATLENFEQAISQHLKDTKSHG